MGLYFSMAITLFFIAVFCSTDVYRNRNSVGSLGIGKSVSLLFILVTIILGGIRWERGTDWRPYYQFFEAFTTWKSFNNGTFEILYAYLNFLVKYFTNSYTAFLFVLSFLVITLSLKVINRLAVFPLLSYYLYFCANIGGMFPVRQTLAIAIVLTSVYFIHKKKKWTFLCIVVIAFMFHTSMLIWLIAYPIYHSKLRKNRVILLFIIATILGIMGKLFLAPFLEFILSPFGSSGRIVSRLIRYAAGNYSDGSYSALGAVLSVCKRMIFIPVFLFLRRKLNTVNNYMPGLLNLFFAGNILYMVFAFNEAFTPLNRMTTPFLFIEVLILPAIISLIRQPCWKYMFLYLLFVYGLLKLNTALNAFPDAYIPYQSVF